MNNIKTLKFFNKLILIFLFQLFCFSFYSLENIVLDDLKGKYPVTPYLEYYEDISNNVTITDILKPEISNQFIKNNKDQLNLGYTKSAYWLKFKIKNNSNITNNYIIDVPYPYLSYIEFYYTENNKYYVKKTGYFVPYNKRDEKNKNYIFHIKFFYNEEKEFYLKVMSDNYMVISINIFSDESFNRIEYKRLFLSGLYYGAMLIILLINLIILLFIRDKTYLYFIIFYFFSVLVQTILDNTSASVIFLDSDWFAINKIVLLPGLGLFFSLFFIDNFFNLKKIFPFRIISFILKAFIIFIIIFLIISKSKILPIKVFSIYTVFCNLFFLFSGFYFFIYKKFKPALYYLFAMTVFILSVFLYGLMGIGLFSPSISLLSLYQIGSIFLVIFMQIALLDKYTILKKEKEDVEKSFYEKEKDKFASIGMLLGGISHEIYNPLSGIMGPLDNLRKNINTAKKPDKEKINKYIDYIEKNTNRIENIIKNIRTLYKKEKITKEKLDIKDIVNSVIEHYNNEPSNKIDFELKIDKKVEVTGDKIALYHILNNLISNAVDSINKTDKVGKITITLEKEKGNKIIHVIDNGSGIMTKDMDKIFNAFYTTKSIGNNIGLGLYIAKDLIIKLGWDIKVSSEDGKGTAFSIVVRE